VSDQPSPPPPPNPHLHPPQPGRPEQQAEPHDRFDEFLRRRGLKLTTERREILDAILAQQDHFEVEGLLFDMRSAGKQVSRATIYRAIELLLSAGLIMKVDLGNGQVRYEHLFKKEHPGFHHHLYCRATGKIEEFSSPELDELIQRICREHGFKPEHMRLVVTGLSREGQAQPQLPTP
jgi:Fur family ferric uptake transcriptional regulator